MLVFSWHHSPAKILTLRGYAPLTFIPAEWEGKAICLHIPKKVSEERDGPSIDNFLYRRTV
jgi:hypothetical protein